MQIPLKKHKSKLFLKMCVTIKEAQSVLLHIPFYKILQALFFQHIFE